MSKVRVLVVDDEKLIRWSFQQNLEKEGYEVFTAASGEEGIEVVKRELPNLVIADIRLPRIDGIEVLRQIKEINPGTLVIMITAHGAIATAVEAMREGAYDYMSKPIEFDEFNLKIEKAVKTLRLHQELTWRRHQESGLFKEAVIVGQSEIMKSLHDLVEKVACGETTTILLEGESGTGKDLFARSIHQVSRRSANSFLDINCSAMQETLIESELFGYEKGAFTDAKASKKGLFELADGGTLYLDEISELSLASQAKLLKFIENRCFKRVGGIKDVYVDVRIIAATNRDLQDAVEEGRFREDLYFRLKVIPITLPPLRDRKEDIQPLAEYFVDRFSREFRKSSKKISEEAGKLLKDYYWPGNVRELRNVIERIMLLEGNDVILSEHLPFEIACQPAASEGLQGMNGFSLSVPDHGISIEEVEKELLLKALAKAQGNQTRAARLLNLSRDTLRYRMKKFGLK